ncbi:MAG: type IV pilus assembly protein PilE [Candidatus Azotimanducaceae bacterium]|jgi:type IV pilus assembly protein PilE
MLAKGYTLIELMVVLAIIGVISAIAYPSYQGYTCDTFIGQAAADMKVCALGMERHYSNGFTYAGAVISTATAAVCPNVSPTDGAAKFDLTLVSNATTFTITAAPVTSSSCGGTMTLTADGTFTAP